MARHECQRRSLCTPAVRSTGLCEAQTTTCEGAFGVGAGNHPIGGGRAVQAPCCPQRQTHPL